MDDFYLNIHIYVCTQKDLATLEGSTINIKDALYLHRHSKMS